MYSFKNDYAEGAHPNILNALIEHNNTQEEGYGLDRHTQTAIGIIRSLTGDNKADVHLLSGGTQTNLIAISSFLRPHEACITATSGHIATHETGAIEATGHKLLTVNSSDGKITAQLIEPILIDHHFEHMVKPRLIYISNPTELGTVYSKCELQDLYDFCRERNLLLYADGARLGSALMSKGADVTIEDMYKLTDAFFIGGTKNGALLGEAIIIKNSHLRADFRYLIKQRGGLLAKGRVLGIQFEELFKDNLYLDLARHANEMAQFMVEELVKTGCSFWIDSPTNQIFPILDNRIIEVLSKKFQFYVWAKTDKDHSAIRLVT
ncbi:MAG: aminotransferase class I/II-fold pyridoxal phosphate-dependent enzyme, partial [Desulforhopalus sp.]|nr:aminotransferase class I/II-fold pyridoxal phosphate-dependent enzyme [Desulforhopalus sp.]